MTSQVEQFLEKFRIREPSIEASVRTWNLRTPAGFWKAKQSKRKGRVAVYLTEEVLREVVADADRHDRTMSKTLQTAWTLAREKIFAYPGAL